MEAHARLFGAKEGTGQEFFGSGGYAQLVSRDESGLAVLKLSGVGVIIFIYPPHSQVICLTTPISLTRPPLNSSGYDAGPYGAFPPGAGDDGS